MLQETTGCIFVVSEVNIKYLRPARLDDQLLVSAKLNGIGRSSFTIQQEARMTEQASDTASTLMTVGSVRIGWVNQQTMKPSRIPPLVQDALKR